MHRRFVLLLVLVPAIGALGAALSEQEGNVGTLASPPALEGALTGDVMRGRALARQCLGCHSVDGSTEFGPTWKDLYGAEIELQDGSVVVADDAYLIESIRDPMAKIRKGFPPTMPPYLSLSDQEVADVVAYIKTHQSLATPALSRPNVDEASPTPLVATRFTCCPRGSVDAE